MAEIELAPNFGAELRDGFKQTNAWVGEGIAWLEDMQQFYRERSAIEKEYAQKLSALGKKFYEKKTRKSATLSVGDTPTVTPGSLESASMTTWGVQLTTLEARAAEHEQFSNLFVQKLADPLKNLGVRYEELRKQHMDHASKLEKERDNAYADLKKAKAKYDASCQEVETRRKKSESHYDKAKARNAYESQLAEMRNVKNTYIIAINITNKQKERYYYEFVPDLVDSLQALNETRVSVLNNLWLQAATLEKDTLVRSTEALQHLASEIPRNNPLLDSMMFLRHNAGNWHEPPNSTFEPSPVWLDDDAMATDSSSKTFLMNLLSKSKASYSELYRQCESKRHDVDRAKFIRQQVREGKDKTKDETEAVRMVFYYQEQLHEAEKQKTIAEVEVSTITSTVGDVSATARSHTFKNQTFKIPTNCDLCGDRIWGLSAKGHSCEECGFTCHTKCELKVPADCPGELNKEQKKEIKSKRQAAAQTKTTSTHTNGGSGSSTNLPQLQRSDTMGSMNTLSSGYAASAHRSVSGDVPTQPVSSSIPASKARPRILAPPPGSYKTGASSEPADGDPFAQTGTMLYAFTGTSPGEISLAESSSFTLLEPDDGSGWIKVRSTTGQEGLVPATYASIDTPPPPRPQHQQRPASPTSSISSRGTSGGNAGTPPPPARNSGKRQGPAVAPRRGAGGVAAGKNKAPASPASNSRMVEALHTFAGSGPGELSMSGGERLELVKPDEGDGWCEVENSAGERGVVPWGWVKEV